MSWPRDRLMLAFPTCVGSVQPFLFGRRTGNTTSLGHQPVFRTVSRQSAGPARRPSPRTNSRRPSRGPSAGPSESPSRGPSESRLGARLEDRLKASLDRPFGSVSRAVQGPSRGPSRGPPIGRLDDPRGGRREARLEDLVQCRLGDPRCGHKNRLEDRVKDRIETVCRTLEKARLEDLVKDRIEDVGKGPSRGPYDRFQCASCFKAHPRTARGAVRGQREKPSIRQGH